MLGEYNAESKTYTAVAGTQASPYTPDVTARLKGLRASISGDAASTLVRHVQFRLTCTTFNPNSIEAGVDGGGLQTAPAFEPVSRDFSVDQQVQAGVPITVEARNLTADTPVGVLAHLYGYFEF
jgi:hypothetical protein